MTSEETNMLTVDIKICGERGERVPIRDVADARAKCNRAIAADGLGLGASKWEGGAIRKNGRVVARLSYNGRLWDPRPYPKCQELNDDFTPKADEQALEAAWKGASPEARSEFCWRNRAALLKLLERPKS
jgi:hypothetical protein